MEDLLNILDTLMVFLVKVEGKKPYWAAIGSIKTKTFMQEGRSGIEAYKELEREVLAYQNKKSRKGLS